ncbi:phosphate signaling complex protein PhoU [Pontivivens nitratireducens]|uniref:Phosphate-specific transport system accessory protein PhoU n=1 Tax=Pontivivens nitratireducens TaxID=2758038 RepID=A0A6G7VJH1_9RHOB|nr:phosphate signaling complex protein PhoU [Pontibrevibacter nitratireducens]QIK40016.1 phosphate signaling complex protein PhoU [Pontibrevibacter nitratireducens]
MGPHIVSSFDDDLIAVQARISEMGGIAEEMLSGALEAVKNRDAQMAQEVIARDKRLDAIEMEVENLATRVIALRQPMAGDLRLLISALKMASTLERVGDLSKNIARRAVYLANARPVKLSSSIVRMGNQTLGQLTEVLDAFTSRDTALAVSVWKRDVEVDEMYNSIFREVVTYMMEDPRTIGLGSQLLFVAKNLERIGDHSTHLAETIYYIVEGTPLGDDRPKGEPLGLEGY